MAKSHSRGSYTIPRQPLFTIHDRIVVLGYTSRATSRSLLSCHNTTLKGSIKVIEKCRAKQRDVNRRFGACSVETIDNTKGVSNKPVIVENVYRCRIRQNSRERYNSLDAGPLLGRIENVNFELPLARPKNGAISCRNTWQRLR